MYSIHNSETGKPLPIALTSCVFQNKCVPGAVSFIPRDWKHDPARGRFYVTSSTGCETEYHWFDVILVGYDNDKTIACKLAEYEKVDYLRSEIYNLQAELARRTR